ncbi:polymorphic toxin type 44 domain-containing protein [Enterococcus rivorum]|uniref:Uncharacterized protein n=2 Tax=Enterococcus rivorum TaxID=762845 RepID=A0A1E5L158_9ENTE|nr:polymorphic toxin type 44 domain-containing protein [Enterococcus rivorum]MBP2098580.1 hypothetical protein [Enterococcus rivorum]OEH83858.1 hypothetical protein BCR26_07610 [Enterococcus rivorum]
MGAIQELISKEEKWNPRLERRYENAMMAVQKLEERIQKLHAFNASSASIFSEYESCLAQLNTGISAIANSGAWNASSGTFDIEKMDMRWANPINERWENRNQLSLDKQITAILNSSDSDAVKTAKIVKAYEDYLYKLNKNAFDEYNNARKKYGDDWFSIDPKMKDIIDDIEQRLSNYLIQSGIDIKAIVRDMGNDILKANRTKDGMSPLDYLYFASIVDTGAPLDLKTRAYSEDYDFSIWARNWTGDMSGDYLGNYLFGYFGQGFLLFDGSLLKLSAGAAQAWSDKDIAKWLKNMNEGNFGDNPNDAQYIEDGIKDYKNRKGNK